MNDISRSDHAALYALASTQAGYFTTAQARAHGVSRRALAHHAARGRFQRVRRGLYRFRDYPSSAYEDVIMAWLAIGADRSVVSHDTALDIYDLTDIIPLSVHLIVPRAQRGLHPPTGVTLHTTVQPLRDDEVTVREGVRLTTPERTLLDVAEAGSAPEQVERGIQTAVKRGWVQPEHILQHAQERGPRVAQLVTTALDHGKGSPDILTVLTASGWNDAVLWSANAMKSRLKEGEVSLDLPTIIRQLHEVEARYPDTAAALAPIIKALSSSDGSTIGTEQARKLLGVGSVNTVKRWIELGILAGRWDERSGRWQIPLADVLRLRGTQQALGAAGGEDLTEQELEALSATRPGTLP